MCHKFKLLEQGTGTKEVAFCERIRERGMGWYLWNGLHESGYFRLARHPGLMAAHSTGGR